MITFVQRLLNDAVLGFLALLSFFLLIAPAVFTLSPAGALTLAGVEHFIILLFAIAYFTGFAIANDKRQFPLNKWRLLAVLTAVALIPATAGGLLGMNLSDTPWPGTLAQVSFGVAAGMALSLYVFIIKGWLR